VSLKDRVIKLVGEASGSLSLRDLLKKLDLDTPARTELKGLLRDLTRNGELVRVRGGRLRIPQAPLLVTGRLHCTPGGFGFVSPEAGGGRKEDVFVPADHLGGALHGDRVVARIERKTPKGLQGAVVRVLERAISRIVGRYEAAPGRVVPFDKRVLHEVMIPRGETSGAEPGQMVVAEITRPPTATRSPAGRILEILGRIEEKGVDLKVVMAKYELPRQFPQEVEEDAREAPTAVTDADREGRTDFRPWLTVTVDPETARDHDDAISLDRTERGHWLLGVHIADVGHYVPEGSALDEEAYLRGTSIYFPETVVPMLPHELSSGICSLVENQDRLTQSVVLELDERGRVVRAEFHDGVIRSVGRMTYEQVQKIVEGDAPLRERYSHVTPLLERMDALAKLMRARRYERGSLDFDLPEPKLLLDAGGEMTAIVATERLDSMRAIEEFMLAANEAVAARLAEAGVPALFRIHETPDPERVEEFAELVASLGYSVPKNLAALHPRDFQLILRQVEGKPEERFVSSLLLRTMRLARYSEQNVGHFGLAATTYSHFTSPIRRYPDLIVHRALRRLRRGAALPEGMEDELPEMALHLSEMERRASDAEREIVEWKKVRFMADKLGETFDGYITGVQSFGLFVELEAIYVQGLVHVTSMTDDFYVFNEKAHTLKGDATRRVYRLGDRVEVQLVRVDLDRRQLDFALTEILERAQKASRPRPRAPKPRKAQRRRAR
jgi:ribonuclease R